MNEPWDCVVIGGGAAGLSAALVLGRARRRTLVIDAGGQANLPAHGIGGLLGHDGRPPSELYQLGRQELDRYPAVEVRNGSVVGAAAIEAAAYGAAAGGSPPSTAVANPRLDSIGTRFSVELESGAAEVARTLILATGMVYRRPEIPGLEELWGDSVFHCPFCHGWEARGQPLAMFGNGDMGVHGALMLRGWTDDVVLVTDGPSELNSDQVARLTTAGVAVEERPVVELVARDGRLSAILLEDGDRLERAGMMVAAPLGRREQFVDRLGLDRQNDNPMVAGAIKVDNVQQTNLPGVFAAGDVTGHSPNVVGAIASGSMAATGVVRLLLAEDFGLPLE